METYKFERLKKQVKDRLKYLFGTKVLNYNGKGSASAHLALVELIESGRIRNGHGRLLGNVLYDQFEKEAIPIIDRWDVREAQSLAALIPNFVPSWVEHGRFTVEYDADGEWVLQKAA